MFRYNQVTATPEELMPIAELFLQWPFETAQKLNKHLYPRPETGFAPVALALYEFIDILCSNNNENITFLINAKPIRIPNTHSYQEIIPKFANIFVLKEDVKMIDQQNRDYCAVPLEHSFLRDKNLCSEKNIHLSGPRIFQAIFTNKDSTESTFRFTKRHVWPNFGTDITKEVKNLPSRTVEEDEEEISKFINTAKILGQHDPYCLAKMVKTRYSFISHQTLAKLIDPDSKRTKAATATQVHRWLTRP